MILRPTSRFWHGRPLAPCPADPPAWLDLTATGRSEWWRCQGALRDSGRWHGLDSLLLAGYVAAVEQIEAAEALPAGHPLRVELIEVATQQIVLAAEALAVPLAPDNRLLLPFGGVQ